MVTDRYRIVIMPAVEDFALLQAWRGGDRNAGDMLMRRHYRGVLRFFEVRTRSAEDLTQRTFLGCVEGRERIREGASFRAYLFGIARKQLLRHLADDKRLDRLASFDEPASAGPGLSTLVATQQEHRLLLAALSETDTDTQMLIALHYWEGLTPTEVAAVFESPPSTIRTRLARAREALRDKIREAAASPARHALECGLDDWVRSVVDDATTVRVPVAPRLAHPHDRKN
jgi:RNA polymerase sigma-70 factor (ECF subfamily)